MRNVAYDAYSLVVLLVRVLLPHMFPRRTLKFRFYMTVRYLIMAVLIGLATVVFLVASNTHPGLYFLTLGTTFIEEVIVTAIF